MIEDIVFEIIVFLTIKNLTVYTILRKNHSLVFGRTKLKLADLKGEAKSRPTDAIFPPMNDEIIVFRFAVDKAARCSEIVSICDGYTARDA